MRAPLAALLVALVVAHAAGPAQADLEFGVGNKTLVTGELSPADEVETLRVVLPAQARLSVVVKGIRRAKGEAAPAPGLRLLDPSGAELATGAPRGKKITLRNVEIPTSGTYRIQVIGDGTNEGQYTADVKWKSRRSVKETIDVADAPGAVVFAADAGSRAVFKVKSARRSAARPRLLQVTANDGDFTHTFAAASSDTARSHVEKRVVLPLAGDYTLQVMNAAPDDGAGVAAVKLAPPAQRRTRALATNDVFPPLIDGTNPDLFAEIIGSAGGELAVGPRGEVGIGIEGARLAIPQGTLPLAVGFFVRRDADIVPEVGGVEPRGPAVFFGPDGFQFDQPVRVSIPFDPEGFGPELSELLVFERNSDGTVRLVPREGYEITLGSPSIVSFPASHFTSFQAFGPVGPAVVFADDLEQGLGDWDFTNGIWELGTPTSGPGSAHSGVNAFGTVLAGNYPDRTDSRLTSPRIRLPEIGTDEALEFRFWEWFRFARGDIGTLAIAEDVAPLVFTSLGARQGTSGVWAEHSGDISAFAGKDVRIALTIRQDAVLSGTSDGWFLDDFRVVQRADFNLEEAGSYAIGFENGMDGWWVSAGIWEFGAPASGPGAARTGTSVAATVLAGAYPDQVASALVTRPIQLPLLDDGEDLRLTFWHWHAFHDTDSLTFEVSERIAPGEWSDWTTLRSYQGSSGVYSRTLLDVSDRAGATVRFNFRIRQDTVLSGTNAGWYLDDFLLEHRTP